MSNNTIKTYCSFSNRYLKNYRLTKLDLSKWYKELEKSNRKASSLNIEIASINALIKYKKIKVDRYKSYKFNYEFKSDNVLSLNEYNLICSYFKNIDLNIFICIKILGTTGIRIGELKNLRKTDIINGTFTLISKGRKQRKVYILRDLQCIISSSKNNNILSTVNKESISIRRFSSIIKSSYKSLDIDKKKIYPHSFRHMFARNFLKNGGDIYMLGQILGHSNINTTKFYLNRTEAEVKEICELVVKW